MFFSFLFPPNYLLPFFFLNAIVWIEWKKSNNDVKRLDQFGEFRFRKNPNPNPISISQFVFHLLFSLLFNFTLFLPSLNPQMIFPHLDFIFYIFFYQNFFYILISYFFLSNSPALVRLSVIMGPCWLWRNHRFKTSVG